MGLSALDQPGLMKKPRSYLKAVLAGNAGRVTPIQMHGKQYLASLGPIESPGVAVATGAAASGTVTTTVPGPLPAAR